MIVEKASIYLYRQNALLFNRWVFRLLLHVLVRIQNIYLHTRHNMLLQYCTRYLSYIQYRARIRRPFKESQNRFPAWRARTTTLFVLPARQATQAGEIDSSESIPGLHKHLQTRALYMRSLYIVLYTYMQTKIVYVPEESIQQFTPTELKSHVKTLQFALLIF